MIFLAISMIVFVLLIIYFVYKLLNTLKKDNFNQTIKVLRKYTYITLVIIGIVYFLSIFLTVIYLTYSEYVYILFIKSIIEIIYFSYIFKDIIDLVGNLEKNQIFVHQNVETIKGMAKSFILLTVTNVIAGIILSISSFISNLESTGTGTIYLQTNISILIYSIIGLILLIITFIFKKAIDIYEDNQLTI